MIKITLSNKDSTYDQALVVQLLQELLQSDNFVKKEEFRTSETGEQTLISERWTAKGRPSILVEYK